MRASYWLPLIALSAISGLSFLLTRSVSHTLAPVFTADFRAFLGGGCVIAYALTRKLQLAWKENWIPYVVIGCLNFAVPFYLYAYAARYLPVAYLGILNSTAPMFGALLSVLVLGERFSRISYAGLLLGLVGVAVICEAGPQGSTDLQSGLAVLACVAGAFSYAAAGAYVKRHASHLSAVAISGGTQFFAGLLMLPLAAANLPALPVRASAVLGLVVLAVLNSAIAYLLYFRLVLAIGATRTLTITFLAPAFAAFMAFVFFGEEVSMRVGAGSLIVLLSVALVNQRFKPAMAEKNA